MPRHSGGLSAEVDGLTETLKAFRGLDADLRKDANSELRTAARACAAVLARDLVTAAAGSGVPVASRVAAAITVKSDRIPVVAIGGAKKVGRYGAPAGALVWGSEQGAKSDPNRFGVAGNSAGYWIAPTVARFEGSGAVEIYKRAVFDLMRKHGLA